MKLNLGAGYNHQEGYISIDKRKVAGVDIVCDLEHFPWPLKDECCSVVAASHIMEHIKPWLTIDFMNEIWRVMKKGGMLAVSVPYAGTPEFWAEPTHCNGFIEATFNFFDPRAEMYKVYTPQPWKIISGYPYRDERGIMHVMMQKMTDEN